MSSGVRVDVPAKPAGVGAAGRLLVARAALIFARTRPTSAAISIADMNAMRIFMSDMSFSVLRPRRCEVGCGHLTELSSRSRIAFQVRYPAAASRGLPISTGWNSTAAASVQTSDSASSLPMLDVPGWLENHRLPNAVAVVSAL